MKSLAEVKFDNVVKQAFHDTLKPLGFKKKANNFYSQKNGLGHIINLQKSTYYSKDHINFTINTAVFLPEFWSVFYNYNNKPVPDFPTEPECILRRRIGELRGERDKWYDITPATEEQEIIDEMRMNLREYILPYFGRVLSKDMVVDLLSQEGTKAAPMEKLIVFGELGDKEKARKEFEAIIKDTTRNPNFLETVRSYGKKYGFV